MAQIWTILSLLNWSQNYLSEKNIQQSRLDSEILLSTTLGLKRLDLYLQFERILNEEELASFKTVLKRRANFEPIAYILGKKEFWSREFEVNSDVLIPRPETELLIEQTLKILGPSPQPSPTGGEGGSEGKGRQGEGERSVLEIGTGSGILAITLAKEIKNTQVDAIDISPKALALAKKNSDRLETSSKINFIEADFTSYNFSKTYDMIISNPPYIPSQEIETLMKDVSNFEPRLALDGGKDGLDFYRKIAQKAPALLKPQGFVVVEIGESQAKDVTKIFEDAGLKNISVIKDYSDHNRVVRGQKIYG